jgi:DNA-binding transcriptional ArsR family regulator
MDPPWPERATIREPAAVGLLTNLTAVTHLSPFTHGPHTLTSAAAALGKPVSTVAYWIPKLVRAGLLEELPPQRRAGLAMRRYRAVARELLVPLAAMPLDRRVALLDEGRFALLRRFLDGLDEVLARNEVNGMLYRAHGDAGPTGLAITAEEDQTDGRRWHDGWLRMRLTDAQAGAFAQELDSLVARYDGGSHGRSYLVHLGLAPEPRHPWRSAEGGVSSR